MSGQTGMDLTRAEQAAVAAETPQEAETLVAMAIREKVPVEVLERLVALQERVTERNARGEFVEALTKFREACPPITKTRENSQFKVTRAGVQRAARYADLGEIDRVARPVAAEHGLVWTWDTRVDGDLMHITCRLIHVAGHSETTNVSMPYESKAGSSPQQKYGSTQTYGMRYSLVAALGLTTVDDDVDGNGASGGGATITPEQAKEINDLADEVGADKAKLCEFLGVESLPEIPARMFTVAKSTVAAKRKVQS